MRFRRACVTGGAGFIGSHLTRRLLQEGLDVTVIDNLSTGSASNLPSAVEFVPGDILDPQACGRAITGCDIVFHLAARVAIRSSFEFAVEDTMTNVSGTAGVLRASAKSGTVGKVIFASSMAVCSDAPGPVPISESHPAHPISPYGISKLAGEQLTHAIAANAGMHSVVLRLFNTYGTGQRCSPYVGVVTIFVNQLSRGEQPAIFGDGEQTRDFVHVSDVAGGFIRAMESDVSGQTCNIGSGVPTTINAVYRTLAGLMGTSITARHEPAVPGELRYSIADITKARTILGYEPLHRFETSVEEVVQDILAGRAAAE